MRYIDDPECAYVMQRYRECHDFYHALTGLPVVVEGEVALKAFEFANTLIPMTGLSMFAFFRLKPEERKRALSTYFPWAIRNGLQAKEVINIYWEEELETDVVELRKRIGLEKPPEYVYASATGPTNTVQPKKNSRPTQGQEKGRDDHSKCHLNSMMSYSQVEDVVVVIVDARFPPRNHNFLFLLLLLIDHADERNEFFFCYTLFELICLCQHDETSLDIARALCFDHGNAPKAVHCLRGAYLGQYRFARFICSDVGKLFVKQH